MSRVISLPALIGQQGPICSQRIQTGSCVAWSLKVSWISAAQLHFLAGGFGIIFNFPRLTTNMKLSVLVKQRRLNRATCSVFRSVATSCWHLSKAGGCECNTFCPPEGRQGCLLEGGGGFTEPLCFITYLFITMSPKCLLVRILSVLYQVWERSEFSGLLIRKWSQPAMIHGVVWLSYYICWTAEAASYGWNVYSYSGELYLHQWDLFPLQCEGLSSLSRVLTDLKRQNNINVWKAVWTQFSFIFLPSHETCSLFSVSARGG